MRDTIAVCLVRANEEFQRDSLCAIYEQAGKYGLSIQVYNVFEELINHNLNDQGEESVFERIDYDSLCGMILFCEKIKDNELNMRLIERGKRNGIPVVSIDRKMEDCYSVLFDCSDAFEQMVRHLLEVHHCKSFFVMGGLRNNDFSDERIELVRRVTSEYGIELKPEDIGYGDFWERPCREEMKRFLDSGRPLPDAFIAVNDSMAIAICEMLYHAGYKVPQDTIVTGFDGIEEGRYAMPRLTTCQQDIVTGGKRAVDIIWNVSRNIEEERENRIPFSPYYSQSCGCEAFDANESLGKVHHLYETLKGYKQFSKYMYDMIDEMTGTRSLQGVLDKLPLYLSYVESFRHAYICVERSYLDVFEGLKAQVMEQNRRLSDWSQVDMVLLGEWHAGKGFKAPLINYRRKDQLPRECKGEYTNHLMFVPLHMRETVFGFLAVDFSPRVNDYTQLRNFSINLSHILDSVQSYQQMQNFNQKLKNANDKLEELYVHDPLTGIYNRRGFYQDIVSCMREHNYGWIMAVSADLNGLKEINDTYGHSEGDFAIKSLGRVLDKCVAGNGICARFGGDEFSAAVFFDEYEQGAEEKFRKTFLTLLSDINKTSGKEYRVTCSCGIEMTTISQGTDIDEILKEADRKMYLDKKRFYEEMGQTEKEIR
ncbi:MAG: diguanylate cyclase domain-containing protein [Acetatifactor sp.]